VLSEYRLKRRVQFYETDAAGIVHFSCFFRYMEEAEHALWREAGLNIHEAGRGIGFPRVATSFEFHRPLRFADEFEVCLRIVGLSRKTIRYSCLLTLDGAKIATGTLVVTCVRYGPNDELASTEIPREIADRFAVASDAARDEPSQPASVEP